MVCALLWGGLVGRCPLCMPRALHGDFNKVQLSCNLLLFHQKEKKHFPTAAGRDLQTALFFSGSCILLTDFTEELSTGLNWSCSSDLCGSLLRLPLAPRAKASQFHRGFGCHGFK